LDKDTIVKDCPSWQCPQCGCARVSIVHWVACVKGVKQK